MKTIPSGTHLFDVWAMDKPEAMGGEEQKIAELVTESTCDTSLFGDEHLFYKH